MRSVVIALFTLVGCLAVTTATAQIPTSGHHAPIADDARLNQSPAGNGQSAVIQLGIPRASKSSQLRWSGSNNDESVTLQAPSLQSPASQTPAKRLSFASVPRAPHAPASVSAIPPPSEKSGYPVTEDSRAGGTYRDVPNGKQNAANPLVVYGNQPLRTPNSSASRTVTGAREIQIDVPVMTSPPLVSPVPTQTAPRSAIPRVAQRGDGTDIGMQILPDSVLNQGGQRNGNSSGRLPSPKEERLLEPESAKANTVVPERVYTAPESGAAGNGLNSLPPSLFEKGTGLQRQNVNAPPIGPYGMQAVPRSGPSGRAVPQPVVPKATVDDESQKAPKYDGPIFLESYGEVKGPQVDVLAKQVPYDPYAFSPNQIPSEPTDFFQEGSPYRTKSPVPVQRPLIELWRPLFSPGLYPPAKTWFGETNLVMPHFMVYGDFRTGAAINRNAGGDFDNLAVRANLDMDLEITATERIHGFFAPLDRGGDFTRLDFTDSAEFVDRTDLRMDTLFFEGDVGSIWGGMTGQVDPFDLPFTFGFLPVFYQNGVWANDNVMGAAFALPSKHSRLLKWSNFDATFFWASDQINSDAFPGDNNAAEFFGTAWFIEAYDGYIEVDYAFVHDDAGQHRSYHNFSVGFTRRYFDKVSNSVRLITNFNQSLPREQRTAEGHLLLIENSWISSNPYWFVPYANFFYGQGRTQSLARAGVAGGVLNNTGINFETDGLTGYPTLDATGVNTTGGAVGVNLLNADFSQQLIVEFAALAANGSQVFRNAPGDQYAVGMRYQKPLTNAWLFRTDHMFGWRRNAQDLRGSRIEFRWKF